MIEDVKLVTKEESKVEQEGVVNKVIVERGSTQNKTHREESFENTNTN